MLRQAAEADRAGISALWQEAFGDTDEAVENFFRAFPDCISYVAEEDGRVVSMVHALPQQLEPFGPGAYIYAVATLQSCRGQGLCRRLMAYAEADLRTRGFACCVLTPGEPGLFAFYTALGYRTAFTRRRTAFGGGTPISMQAYGERRRQLLREPHMVCDDRVLAYAAQVYGLTFYETAEGIAAASPGYTAEVLPQDLQGERAAFAMVKWLGDKAPEFEGYLGFALE